MRFRVFELYGFRRRLKKLLSLSELARYERFKKKLKQGTISGKPLSVCFFREQKIGGKRIYFLLYADIRIVLFVASSDKKEQQQTINEIKEDFERFRKIAVYLSKKKK